MFKYTSERGQICKTSPEFSPHPSSSNIVQTNITKNVGKAPDLVKTSATEVDKKKKKTDKCNQSCQKFQIQSSQDRHNQSWQSSRSSVDGHNQSWQ